MNALSTVSSDEWLNESLLCFAKTRNCVIRDEIAHRTSWIAERSARRFWNKGEPFDDLVQVANIGLLMAIERFDPSLGVPFGAYATPTIVGELRRYFRDFTWSVHVPRPTKDMQISVNSAREELEKRLQRSPQASEIALFLDVSVEFVNGVLAANNAHYTYSLERTEIDSLSIADSPFDDVLNHEVLSHLLCLLTPRQTKILVLHFYEEMSQSEIAQQVGISQAHVGRLIASSLDELRCHIDCSD